MDLIKRLLKAQSLTATDDVIAGEDSRQEAHKEQLKDYGFPEEQDEEKIATTKYSEIDNLDENDQPTHRKVPWEVNEAGDTIPYLDENGKDVSNKAVAKAFMKYFMKDDMKSNKYWKKPAKTKTAKTPSKSERFDVRSKGQAATEKYHTPSERQDKRLDAINRTWAANKEKADKDSWLSEGSDLISQVLAGNKKDPEKMLKDETVRRGAIDVDVSDTGHRGKAAEIRGLNPATGRPYRQVGSSPPLDEEGKPTETSFMTDNWTENAPDSLAEQDYMAQKARETLAAYGSGPSGLGSGENWDHISNPSNKTGDEQFPGQKVDPANVANPRAKVTQETLAAIRNQKMMKGSIKDLVNKLRGKKESPNYRSAEPNPNLDMSKITPEQMKNLQGYMGNEGFLESKDGGYVGVKTNEDGTFNMTSAAQYGPSSQFTATQALKDKLPDDKFIQGLPTSSQKLLKAYAKYMMKANGDTSNTPKLPDFNPDDYKFDATGEFVSGPEDAMTDWDVKAQADAKKQGWQS